MLSHQTMVRSLSTRVFDLVSGHLEGPDASADGYAAILGLIQSGYDAASIHRLAWTEESAAFRHYRSFAQHRNKGAARRKLDADIGRARHFIAQRPAARDEVGVQAVLAELSNALDVAGAEFKGKAGNTDLAVLNALVALAQKACSPRLSVSTRQLGELVGVRANTAAASLRRLTESGRWLRQAAPAHGDKAASFDLRRPDVAIPADYPDLAIERYQRDVFADLPDVFMGPNLGIGSGRVYAALHEDEAATVDQLARLTGRSRSAVYAALRKLAATGLIRRTVDGWTRVSGALATVVAIPVRARLRRLHRLEREGWLNWLSGRRSTSETARRRFKARAIAARRGLVIQDRTLIDPDTGLVLGSYTETWEQAA